MKLNTHIHEFAGFDVEKDERLKGFNKAVKFDSKIRVSPSIYFLLTDLGFKNMSADAKKLELDLILRNLRVIDLDDVERVKENMKLLPPGLMNQPLKLK